MLKTIDDVRRFVESVAGHKGWVLIRDTEFLGFLMEGLHKNYTRYGFFMCPCRDSDGDKEKDQDLMCPCAYCVPDQEQYGHCFCGLYMTPAFAATGKEPAAIPERRPPEKMM